MSGWISGLALPVYIVVPREVESIKGAGSGRLDRLCRRNLCDSFARQRPRANGCQKHGQDKCDGTKQLSDLIHTLHLKVIWFSSGVLRPLRQTHERLRCTPQRCCNRVAADLISTSVAVTHPSPKSAETVIERARTRKCCPAASAQWPGGKPVASTAPPPKFSSQPPALPCFWANAVLQSPDWPDFLSPAGQRVH